MASMQGPVLHYRDKEMSGTVQVILHGNPIAIWFNQDRIKIKDRVSFCKGDIVEFTLVFRVPEPIKASDLYAKGIRLIRHSQEKLTDPQEGFAHILIEGNRYLISKQLANTSKQDGIGHNNFLINRGFHLDNLLSDEKNKPIKYTLMRSLAALMHNYVNTQFSEKGKAPKRLRYTKDNLSRYIHGIKDLDNESISQIARKCDDIQCKPFNIELETDFKGTNTSLLIVSKDKEKLSKLSSNMIFQNDHGMYWMRFTLNNASAVLKYTLDHPQYFPASESFQEKIESIKVKLGMVSTINPGNIPPKNNPPAHR